MAPLSVSKTTPKLGSAVGEGVVVLKVGPNQKQFHIHKALLVHHSEYFRKALNGPWKEAEEGVIKIEDVEPEMVDVFVHWLYFQSLPGPCDTFEWDRIVDHTEDQSLLKIRAYVFADRFLCPGFRRMVNKNLVDGLENFMAILDVHNFLSYVQEAYAGIPSDRPILQFLVDVHCDTWMQCWENGPDTVSEFPHAFVVRAMRRLQEQLLRNTRDHPEKLRRCYYEHASDEEKKICLSAHMDYDEEKDFGFFGKRVTCGQCPGDDDSGSEGDSESSSESESESESDDSE